MYELSDEQIFGLLSELRGMSYGLLEDLMGIIGVGS